MIVWDKVLVKNLNPEDVQTGYSNGHVVDQQIERASNFTYEEKTMNISPILEYLVYYGSGKDSDAARFY